MRKKFKKLVVLILGVCLLTSLVGCNKDKDNNDEDVTTTDIGKIEIGNYKGVEVTKTLVEVTEEEIDSEINYFVSELKEDVEITDRTDVQDGDIANINYAGKVDGVAFDGGTDDTEVGTDLEIGSGSFIDGFEEQLIGVNVLETVDITVTFPDPYTQNTDLSGKEAVFTVTVNAIYNTVEPELTDALIAENTESTTIAEYRESLREELLLEKEEAADNQMKTDAIDVVIANSKFTDIPDSILDKHKTQLIEYHESMAAAYGVDLAFLKTYLFGLTDEQYEEQISEAALYAAQQNLIAEEIIKLESLKITDEEYTAGVSEYALNYQYESVEAFEAQNKKEDIEKTLLYDKALNIIFDNMLVK